MSGSGYVRELAAFLRELKGRTDLSYASLARRTGVSASALHRYCSGCGVPGDYEVLGRFGKACGAASDELLELHRLWVLAAEDRRTAARSPRALRRTATSGGRPGAVTLPDQAAAPEQPSDRADSTPTDDGPPSHTDDDPPPTPGAHGPAGDNTPDAPRGASRDQRPDDGPQSDRPAPASDSGSPPDDPDRARETPQPVPLPGEPYDRGASDLLSWDDPDDDTPVTDGPPARHPRHRWILLGAALIALAASVLAGAILLGLLDPSPLPQGKTGDSSGRLLLSSSCPVVVSMGQQDDCVRELQSLLSRSGGDLDVDGAFGPITQTRVVAFQLYAGLTTNGAVDERTKRALYERKVRMKTWPRSRVERRIREVFTEVPDRAVGIARCQSSLDPLWNLPNTDGSRNWGVFQLSDQTIQQLGGTRMKALSPDWNIRAAHRLWKMTGDFSAWACSRAYRTEEPASSSPRPSSR